MYITVVHIYRIHYYYADYVFGRMLARGGGGRNFISIVGKLDLKLINGNLVMRAKRVVAKGCRACRGCIQCTYIVHIMRIIGMGQSRIHRIYMYIVTAAGVLRVE